MLINHGIALARVLATCMVVVIHVSALVLNNVSSEYASWWLANLIDSMSRSAVPLFLMISGYLTLAPKKYSSTKDFLIKRFCRICPALFIWTVVYFILSNLIFYINHGCLNWDLLVHNIYVGEVFYHLWYMYMFLGLILITPFIEIIIKKTSRINVYIFTAVCNIASMVICIYDTDYDNSLFLLRCFPYIGYYMLGYCFKFISLKRKSYLYVALIIGLIITFMGKYYCNTADCYTYRYLSINVWTTSISMFLLLKDVNIDNKTIAEISYVSMGIYYLHPIIVKLVEYVLLDYLLSNVIALVVITLLVILFSCLMALLLSKNRVMKILVI